MGPDVNRRSAIGVRSRGGAGSRNRCAGGRAAGFTAPVKQDFRHRDGGARVTTGGTD